MTADVTLQQHIMLFYSKIPQQCTEQVMSLDNPEGLSLTLCTSGYVNHLIFFPKHPTRTDAQTLGQAGRRGEVSVLLYLLHRLESITCHSSEERRSR